MHCDDNLRFICICKLSSVAEHELERCPFGMRVVHRLARHRSFSVVKTVDGMEGSQLFVVSEHITAVIFFLTCVKVLLQLYIQVCPYPV